MYSVSPASITKSYETNRQHIVMNYARILNGLILDKTD